MVVMPDGGFLIADAAAARIRRVSATGIITTVADTGTPGYSGDGGPATAAEIYDPNGVAVAADGGFLIADGDYMARRVSPTGIVTTVAGTGVPGSSGDGGGPTAAQLDTPSGIAPTADGGFLIADWFVKRVRWVSPTGVITTVAGTSTPAVFTNGDGDPATAANIVMSFAVATTPTGGFVFTEDGNYAIRIVDAGFAITPPPPTSVPGAPTIGSPTFGNCRFTVQAINNAGSGPQSSRSNQVTAQ
jgi:hypothetical protein